MDNKTTLKHLCDVLAYVQKMIPDEEWSEDVYQARKHVDALKQHLNLSKIEPGKGKIATGYISPIPVDKLKL